MFLLHSSTLLDGSRLSCLGVRGAIRREIAFMPHSYEKTNA
jgi:hypothetical protein